MAHQDAGKAADVAADARNRGWRTFVQGVGVDVALAVLTALTALTSGEVRWTRAYWIALAGLVARSAVVALVAAVSRRVYPPSTVDN